MHMLFASFRYYFFKFWASFPKKVLEQQECYRYYRSLEFTHQIYIRMKTRRFVSELVPPFTVGVISRAVSQEGATGFNLVYNQVPCN